MHIRVAQKSRHRFWAAISPFHHKTELLKFSTIITKKLKLDEKKSLALTQKRISKAFDGIGFLNKLASTGFRSNHGVTNETLKSYIISDQTEQQIKHACYLALIKTAPLEILQELQGYMDFSYRDRRGNDAVLTACAHDRQDVLRWLVFEKELSLAVKDQEHDGPIEIAIHYGYRQLLRSLVTPERQHGYGLMFNTKSNNRYEHPVLRAAASGQTQVFRELTTPVADGGYGFSLKAADRLNNDALMLAADEGNWDAVCELLKPQAQDGFGWEMQRNIIRNHPYDQQRNNLNVPAYITILGKVRGIEDAELCLINTNTWTPEVYRYQRHIAHGSYGSAELFTFNDKKIVVKCSALRRLSDFDTFNYLRKTCQHEYKYLCKVYPEYGPYSYQMVRIQKDGDIFFGNYITMPEVPGKDLVDICDDLTNSLEVAYLFLGCAQEVNRLHQEKGMIHGDLTPGNLMARMKENGSFDIRLIDFYTARDIGDEHTFAGVINKKHAPELRNGLAAADPSQDVWTLAATFRETLNYLPSSKKSLINSDVEKYFPAITTFSEMGQNINPNDRQSLSEFITKLQIQIHVYKYKTHRANSGVFSHNRAHKKARVDRSSKDTKDEVVLNRGIF